jgi:hypothetical protein
LGDKTCQSRRGDSVDASGVACFLAAICPAQWAVSLATLDSLDAQARPVDQQGQRRLARVDYEADRARRRFRAVHPDKRRVARRLARDWNARRVAADPIRQE